MLKSIIGAQDQILATSSIVQHAQTWSVNISIAHSLHTLPVLLVPAYTSGAKTPINVFMTIIMMVMVSSTQMHHAQTSSLILGNAHSQHAHRAQFGQSTQPLIHTTHSHSQEVLVVNSQL